MTPLTEDEQAELKRLETIFKGYDRFIIDQTSNRIYGATFNPDDVEYDELHSYPGQFIEDTPGLTRHILRASPQDFRRYEELSERAMENPNQHSTT